MCDEKCPHCGSDKVESVPRTKSPWIKLDIHVPDPLPPIGEARNNWCKAILKALTPLGITAVIQDREHYEPDATENKS